MPLFSNSNCLCSSVYAFVGPALFLTCPMDADKSQKWFSELWNGAIVPYLSQMNKELTVQVCVVSCFLCVVLKRPFCGHVPHFPSGHSSKENLFRRMGLFHSKMTSN